MDWTQPHPPTEGPLATANAHAEQFTAKFLAWLPENLHVYDAFEREALLIIRRGFRHYSARTIVHVLRHHSAVAENSADGFKVNNDVSPSLARLFAMIHPEGADLFEYRRTSVERVFEGGAHA